MFLEEKRFEVDSQAYLTCLRLPVGMGNQPVGGCGGGTANAFHH